MDFISWVIGSIVDVVLWVIGLAIVLLVAAYHALKRRRQGDAGENVQR